MLVIPILKRLRKENHKIVISVDYIARHYLKKASKQTNCKLVLLRIKTKRVERWRCS